MGNYKLVIKAGKVITPFHVYHDYVVAVDNEGKIGFIGPKSEFTGSGDLFIDASDKILAPGFIDIHIHGANGADVIEGKIESVERVASFIVKHGVTGFYPTTVTSPLEMIKRSIKSLVEAIRRGVRGARILGIHTEGPFFSLEKAGAQDRRYLLKPSIDLINELLELGEGYIKRVTLAPEIDGALDAIRFLKNEGIVVAMGHTNATYDEAIRAIEAGATVANHIYNQMRNFHHRDPGILGAVLTRDDVYAEIIIDEVHHHYAAREIVIRCKGTDKVALITDSIMATGLPDGEYMLGAQKIIIKNGVSRLPDGTLAGSTLTMDRAIRNTVRHLNVSLQDAIKMATYVPAKIMGIDSRYGSIKIGKQGDLVILDNDMNVLKTIINGEVIYSHNK